MKAKEKLSNLIKEAIEGNPEALNNENMKIMRNIEQHNFEYKGIKNEQDSILLLYKLANCIKEMKGTNLKNIFYSVDSEIQYLQQIEAIMSKGKFVGRFEWIDSELVKGVQNGSWIIIKNANACSPSVLDRINPLLDEDNELIINEAGIIGNSFRVVKRHPHFRIFFVYDYKLGELSRSLRNRCIEICFSEVDSKIDWSIEPIKDLKLSQGNNAEKWTYINSLQKSIKFSREYAKHCIQLLKSIGIKSYRICIAMIAMHHCIWEIGEKKLQETMSIRQLISWGKLCSKMATLTSNYKKAWIKSCKLAYFQNFYGVSKEKFNSLVSDLWPIKSNIVLNGWQNMPVDTLEFMFSSHMNYHNIELILALPLSYWLNYHTFFLNIVEYALREISNAEQTTDDTLSQGNATIIQRKRLQAEISDDHMNDLFVKNPYYRTLFFEKLHISPELLKLMVLKLLPYAEYDGKGMIKDYKYIQKFIGLFASDNNKEIRSLTSYNSSIMQIITSSDINCWLDINKSRIDQNSYFAKKLTKLRRISQHAFIQNIDLKEENIQTVKDIIYLIDFALSRTLESTSNVGLSIFPCIDRLRKLLPLIWNYANDVKANRLINKIYEKSLASCSIEKEMLNAPKNETLAKLIKIYRIDELLPKAEYLYKSLQKFLRIVSPYIAIIGQRQEIRNCTLLYSQGLNDLVNTFIKQYEQIQALESENQNLQIDLELTLKTLEAQYSIQNNNKAVTHICIDISDLDIEDNDEEDAEGNPVKQTTANITIIEKIEDIKILKSQHLINFGMILKDYQALSLFFELISNNTQKNAMDKNLTKRYIKRKTTIIPQIFSNLTKDSLTTTDKLWTYSTILLNKVLLSEYILMVQRKTFPGKSLNKQELMINYLYSEFSKTMKLCEMSYKMDYILHLKNYCSKQYSKKDSNQQFKKVLLFVIQTISSTSNDSSLNLFYEDIMKLLNSSIQAKGIYEQKGDIFENALLKLKDLIKFTEKWKVIKVYQELLDGINKLIQDIISEFEQNNKTRLLSDVERIEKLSQIFLYALCGKIVLISGYPAINIGKQMRLPIYIEEIQYALQQIYEEILYQTWFYESKTQNYKSTSSNPLILNLHEILSKKESKLKKYKSQYRYRDISQLGSLYSLISSLSAKATSNAGLIEALQNLLGKSNKAELIVIQENIRQGLLKILTNYVDCNQDMLIFYIIGLATLLKTYRMIEANSLNPRKKNVDYLEAVKIIKSGEIIYDLTTKKIKVTPTLDIYESREFATDDRLSKYSINYMELLEQMKKRGKNKLKRIIFARYMANLAEQYLAIGVEEGGQIIYKYKGQSLSDRIVNSLYY